MYEDYNPHWYRVTNPCSEILMETGKKEETMNKLYEIIQLSLIHI